MKTENNIASNVRFENLPDLHVASVRHIGDYKKICEAFDSLYAWASPQGLLNPSANVFGIYYDMPGSVPTEKLRSEACITVPEGTKDGGPVTIKTLPTKGRFALGRFEFDGQEGFAKAWNSMMGEWLPKSGLICDEKRVSFELYCNDCSTNHYVVDICIPIAE